MSMRPVLALAALLGVMAPGVGWAAGATTGIVTASQVNGTWRSGKNEFKLLALGRNQLKVEFAGTHEYRSSAGPSAHTGELSAVGRIEGTTAILKPADLNGECTITMKFAPGRMVVTQDGECGFGLGVTADGMYRRVSSRKPSFSE